MSVELLPIVIAIVALLMYFKECKSNDKTVDVVTTIFIFFLFLWMPTVMLIIVALCEFVELVFAVQDSEAPEVKKRYIIRIWMK